LGDRCPSCASGDTRSFYEAKGVPVHDVSLMLTREEATSCLRGDIVLAACRQCGFIFNSAHDPSLQEYSACYEPTQWFSPKFDAFARSLAQRLVDRYSLRGKDILEIGCGKGEFLALLCKLGDNRGTGIDKAYVPERTPPELANRLTFIRDFYTEKYAHLKADFICCRHTLEHIDETGGFIRMLRRAIGDQTDTVVFFEVPDVTRILHEGAFWDVYYEHCSYFSPGSLARLFRASGFEIDELDRVYQDHYIVITCRPADCPSGPSLEVEDDMQALQDAVGGFTRLSEEQIDLWRRRVNQRASQGRRTVIWGSGSKAVTFLTTLALDDQIACVVDVNPYKHGKFMPGTGHGIVPPQGLADIRPDAVIVMNPVYRGEIQAELGRMGLTPQLLSL